MKGNLCKCGCGQMVTSLRRDGTVREFIHGHNSRLRKNEWSNKPESDNKRTGRWRARKAIDTSHCALEHTGECHGRIEVHHLDKNPLNNKTDNVIAVCKTHHAFLDNGKITIDEPKIPEYWIDGAGKRRYKA